MSSQKNSLQRHRNVRSLCPFFDLQAHVIAQVGSSPRFSIQMSQTQGRSVLTPSKRTGSRHMASHTSSSPSNASLSTRIQTQHWTKRQESCYKRITRVIASERSSSRVYTRHQRYISRYGFVYVRENCRSKHLLLPRSLHQNLPRRQLKLRCLMRLHLLWLRFHPRPPYHHPWYHRRKAPAQ